MAPERRQGRPMRKVIVNAFATADGVMQAPGGSDEDREGGFKHGGWQGPYFDDAQGAAVDEAYRSSGGMLLGRTTYEIFASYWPNPPDPEGKEFAHVMNDAQKYVVSTNLKEPLEWQNSTLISGDLKEEITKLKEMGGGDLQVVGSSKLGHSLAELGLVDEYLLFIHPVVIGEGKRVFADPGPRMGLRLLDQKATPKGVLILRYAVE